MIYGHGDDAYRYEGIRLNFSSNIPSFADSSALEEHLRQRMSLIRSYPEPTARRLEARIAAASGLKTEEVMVTSGATEAIYMIAQCFSRQLPDRERTYTVMHPTFSEYDSACRMFGMREDPEGSLCWLCNPNNPTGEIYDERTLWSLAARHSVMVIDQSYEDYTLAPLPQWEGGERTIVLHSMTKKYCIPGLRLGYVTAPSDVLDNLRRCQRPWAVNALALEAGMWLVEHRPRWVDIPAYLAETQRLCTALNAIPGIRARQTQTNFILCTIEGRTAAQLKEHLAQRHGILIRDASNFPGLSPHHFRVSAQRPADNDELLRALLTL